MGIRERGKMMEQIKGYFFALFSAVLLGLMAVLVKIVLNMGLSTLGVISSVFPFHRYS